MPIYEYEAIDRDRGCPHCRVRFEVRQGMQDPPLETCPQCAAAVRRVISACGICTRTERSMLSDRNLKEKGFKKLVNEGDGKFRNVL